MAYRDAKTAREARRQQLHEQLAALTPEQERIAELRDELRTLDVIDRREAHKRWTRPLLTTLLIVGTPLAVLGFGCWAAMATWQDRCGANARNHVNELRQVAQRYLALHGDAACPSIETLLVSDALDLDYDARDMWGSRYRLACSADGDVIATSAGRDGQHGTDDDLVSR